MTALENEIPDLDDPPRRTTAGPDAFTRLAGRFRDQIRGWARRLTGDHDEAEDIAQDVLLRLHARGHAVDDPRRMVGWLYRVTHNVAHDRRALARRRAELLAEFSDPGAVASPEGVPSISAEGLVRLVADCREVLTARQREVFTLVDLEGRSADEVAGEVGVAASTVRVHLARARRTIRLRMLAEHPELLEDYTP